MRRPDRTVATADHNVPTDGTPVAARIKDEFSRVQVETLERNCEEFGIPLYSLGSEHQGIVHVIGPELGLTQPGMTIVCGDSHTATHGAFGALAFGIGTSEVEHVLATQCLVQRKPKSMRIRYEGELGFGVTAKDLILATIGQMGVDGAVGHVVEYAGPGDRGALDGGPHDGLQHDDRGRRARGDDRARRHDVRLGRRARRRTSTRRGASCAPTTARASTARSSSTRAALSPMVSWGTNPAQVVGVADARPRAGDRRRGARAALHGPAAGTPIQDIRLDRVFIGSCTNSRIGDLRAAARVIEGRKVAADVYAMVVPGSVQVKLQAEAEGLDDVFRQRASTGAARAARCAWA